MIDAGEPQEVGDDAAMLPAAALEAVWSGGPAALDPAIAAAGEAHLTASLATWPAFYDGPVGCLAALRDGVATLATGSFFDVLRSDGAALDPAGRERATALAGGDPLRRGDGRAAGFGVSLLLTRDDDGDGRRALVGLRSTAVVNAGRWHTVPAGTVDVPATPTGAEPLRATAALEAREELGIDIDPGALVPLGWAWDLPTLRPEAVFRLDAAAIEPAGHCAEHDRLAWVPVDAPPPGATPILRAALALAARAA